MNNNQTFDNLKRYEREGNYKAMLNATKTNIAIFERNGARFFVTLDLLNSLSLYLIPFVENGKYGFVNRMCKPLIAPIYDEVKGSFFNDKNYVAVKRENKWSVIDSKGDVIFPFKYNFIFPSPDSSLVTCCDYSGWSVIDANTKNIIVDSSKYKLIEGFRYGYARVKNDDDKWGIINARGELVLNTEYESIYTWNEWYEPTTKVKKTEYDKEKFIELDKLK
jgi:hypothetical protein